MYLHELLQLLPIIDDRAFMIGYLLFQPKAAAEWTAVDLRVELAALLRPHGCRHRRPLRRRRRSRPRSRSGPQQLIFRQRSITNHVRFAIKIKRNNLSNLSHRWHRSHYHSWSNNRATSNHDNRKHSHNNNHSDNHHDATTQLAHSAGSRDDRRRRQLAVRASPRQHRLHRVRGLREALL